MHSYGMRGGGNYNIGLTREAFLTECGHLHLGSGAFFGKVTNQSNACISLEMPLSVKKDKI
jgi:hypothetical protein